MAVLVVQGDQRRVFFVGALQQLGAQVEHQRRQLRLLTFGGAGTIVCVVEQHRQRPARRQTALLQRLDFGGHALLKLRQERMPGRQ